LETTSKGKFLWKSVERQEYMETISTIHENDEIPYWEKMSTKSKYARYTSEIERLAILKAHSLAPRPVTALEIGCEGGRWSKLLSDLGWSMLCIDSNQSGLNICQKRIPTATCLLVSPDDSQLPLKKRVWG
jgi:hypothetical protein